MGSFSDVSLDLLHLILAKCDKPSLLSLTRVSRSIGQQANAFLYAEINWEWQRGPCSKNPPIHLLLRTLITRPDLATLIKRVSLNVDDTYARENTFMFMKCYLEGVEPPVFDPEIADLATGLVKKLGLPQKSRWGEAIAKRNIDALVALTISQLQSLETLMVDIYMLHHSVFLGLVFRQLIQTDDNDHFPRLRYVQFGRPQPAFFATCMEANMDYVVPLFLLPAIETIDLTVDIFALSSRPARTSHRGPRSLTTLNLWNCEIEPGGVAQLLEMTPALKHLQCELLRDERGFVESDKCDFSDLHTTLSRKSDTLESLLFRVTWCDKKSYSHAVPLEESGKVPMGSLRSFHRLSDLHVPSELLLGTRPWSGQQLSKALPPNIQFLTLTDGPTTWDPSEENVSNPFGDENSHIFPKRNYSMQPIIDVLAEYLKDREHNAPLPKTFVLSHPSIPSSRPIYRGRNSTVRPRSQLEQLRDIAEAANVEVHVQYQLRITSWSKRGANIMVYNPATPEVEPWQEEKKERAL